MCINSWGEVLVSSLLEGAFGKITSWSVKMEDPKLDKNIGLIFKLLKADMFLDKAGIALGLAIEGLEYSHLAPLHVHG